MVTTEEKRYVHICEVCGKTEVLTPAEAYEAGWDYPPRMGMFGVLSPRICPSCPITKTLWWALNEKSMSEKKSNIGFTELETDISGLDEKQQVILERILNEPESIEVPEGNS